MQDQIGKLPIAEEKARAAKERLAEIRRAEREAREAEEQAKAVRAGAKGAQAEIDKLAAAVRDFDGAPREKLLAAITAADAKLREAIAAFDTAVLERDGKVTRAQQLAKTYGIEAPVLSTTIEPSRQAMVWQAVRDRRLKDARKIGPSDPSVRDIHLSLATKGVRRWIDRESM